MGRTIHAKATETGHVFRLWSTTSDTYVTPEMTKEQLVRYMVEDAIEEAVSRVGALVSRTSSHRSVSRDSPRSDRAI